MKKKKIFGIVASILMCATLMGNSVKAASTGYFNKYTNASQEISAVGLTGMQGMCVDTSTNTAYCVKVNTGKDTNAAIFKVNLSAKKTVRMTTPSGSNIFTGLYHANDMEFVKINGTNYLFVVTCNKNAAYQLIKFKITGSILKKVASYKIKNSAGKSLIPSGIALVNNYQGNNLCFLLKSGKTLYRTEINKNLKDKSTIKTASSTCNLNLANSTINGKKIGNIGNYLSQGFTYYKGKVYTPYTYKNVSVIFVFSINGTKALPAKATGLKNLSFRITSGAYSKNFEIESCAIGKDGKLYFNYNAETAKNVASDKIAYFNNYKW